MAVGLLRDLQVPEHPSRRVAGAHGQKAPGGLDEIPRPREVIAPQVVVALRETPRDRQARDDAAFDAFRLVRLQDGRAEVIERPPGTLGSRAAADRLVPRLPPGDVRGTRR